MKRNYSVSVVILTWNSDKYIEDCINSVFVDALFSNIQAEVIVVDSGSSDGTIKILEKLKEKCLNFNTIKLDKNCSTKLPGYIYRCKFLGRL